MTSLNKLKQLFSKQKEDAVEPITSAPEIPVADFKEPVESLIDTVLNNPERFEWEVLQDYDHINSYMFADICIRVSYKLVDKMEKLEFNGKIEFVVCYSDVPYCKSKRNGTKLLNPPIVDKTFTSSDADCFTGKEIWYIISELQNIGDKYLKHTEKKAKHVKVLEGLKKRKQLKSIYCINKEGK